MGGDLTPAYSSDISFDDFLHRNEDEIARIIDEHQQHFRYVFKSIVGRSVQFPSWTVRGTRADKLIQHMTSPASLIVNTSMTTPARTHAIKCLISQKNIQFFFSTPSC